jgi:hypothetical protein
LRSAAKDVYMKAANIKPVVKICFMIVL